MKIHSCMNLQEQRKKIEKIRESQWRRAKNSRQCQAHTHLAKAKILQYHTTIQDQ